MTSTLDKIQLSSKYNLSLPFLAFLFDLFEKGELVPKNKELKNDIQKAIDTIQKIEAIDIKRKTYYKKKGDSVLEEQTYKSYPQSCINDLNSLIGKYPLNIGIAFEEFMTLTPRGFPRDAKKKNLEKIVTKLKSLCKSENLARLRFQLLSTSFEIKSLRDEKQLRNALTSCLFMYAQKLIHGNFERPRRCPSCEDWFLAQRRNHVYCMRKCKDFAYGDTRERKKQWKEASKRYRDKKKRHR